MFSYTGFSCLTGVYLALVLDFFCCDLLVVVVLPVGVLGVCYITLFSLFRLCCFSLIMEF